MRKFLSLSFNTARDIVRQPLIAILMVACLVTLGFLPVVAVFSLGQEARIVRDGAVASCFIYGLFLVVASSVASISKQVRSGTAGSVLAKPVSREMFFMATYGGIILVCLLFVGIGTVAAMLSVRMAYGGMETDWLIGMVYAAAILLALAAAGVANYRGRNFCSALWQALLICLMAALFVALFIGPTGKPGNFGGLINWRLLPVALLLFGALAMLAAIALALSISFKPVVVLFCSSIIFIVGLLSDYLFYTLTGGNYWAQICSALLPDWQSLGIYEALDISFAAAWKGILQSGGYAFLYIGAVLCLGVLVFKKAEV